MAEVVELRRERLLPEYEEMKKFELFTDGDIRSIIKTRESFEYKISRPTKTIKNFVEYITYERNLRSKVTERWKSLNKGQVCSIETSISNHIRNLYKQALSRFPEEVRLWTNYLKFLKHANFLQDCSTAFEKMLQYHFDKADIWLKAAMWEYHETHNLDRAKSLFLRGLQRHPEDHDLYLKFFNVMLSEASKMNSDVLLENMTESEQSLGCQRAEVLYDSARKKICNCEFYVNLLEIATQFSFTKKLQKKILVYMMDTFYKDELLWHTLAQRELKGHNMSSLSEEEIDVTRKEGEEFETRKTLRRKLELGFEVYSKAVKELKTEQMWTYFITAMLELNEDMSTQREFKRKCLAKAFKGAYEAQCLSEYHYLQYLELLLTSNESKDFTLEVLERGTCRFTSSLKLWEIYMRYYIIRADEKKTVEIFRRAVKKLGPDSHPLWRMMIIFYQTFPDNSNRVDKLFEEAARQTHTEFDRFRPEYLEWVAVSKSIEACRKVYKEFANLPPPSLAIHEKMAELESIQIKPDLEAWRQCHEYACQYFGKTQTGVWINYIKFERDEGEAKNISRLVERAKQTLSDDLVDNFISEHSLLTTGVF